MAVDPYVPIRSEDAPRRSVAIPAARGWRATRPGDLVAGDSGLAPDARLAGSPGPDGGYALTLAKRFRGRLETVEPETRHDAELIGAEVAMRRASMFGRAPISADLELAFTLFGWLGGAPPELVEWRRLAAAGVGHAYPRRRTLVNAIPEVILRRSAEEVRGDLGRWRELLGQTG